MLIHRLGILTAALLGLSTLDAPTASASPADCKVITSSGRCLVQALDPGRPGGPAGPPVAAAPSNPQPRRQQPAARRDPRGTPAEQDVARDHTADVTALAQRRLLGLPDPPAVAAGAAPEQAAAPRRQVDPAVPTRIAISQLDLRAPVIRMSNGGQPVFVGVPVWLWIEQGEGLTDVAGATAAVGNAEVRASARLTSVEWSLGPDGARVTCIGPGTPWTGQEGKSPDCGYTYTQRSLPERTGGTGRWPVTATSVWQVAWNGVSAGAPVQGAQTLRLTSEFAVPVDEIQVLVSGGGS
jgi:hypothetical protein